jgi:DNA-binding CsgD family transcriptional regulator
MAYFTGMGEEAAAALREAVEIHRARGDLPAQGRALRRLAIQLGQNGALAEAKAAVSEAVAVLEQLPPGPELARACNTMAAVLGVFDDDAALRWGKRAIELAEEVGCLDAVAEALNIVGIVELRQGNMDGLVRLDRSRELAEQAGDEFATARAYVNPAAVLAARCEWVLADRYIQPGLAFCREHGLDHWLGWLTTMAAEAALARGRWDEAVSTAEAIQAWPVDRFPHAHLSALVIGARAQARRGEPGYWPALDEAVQAAKAAPVGHVAPLVAAARAEAAWLEGAPAERIGEVTGSPGELGLANARWFAGELAVWRHRAGLDGGDPAGLPEPYRLEITGDAEGAARWWLERDCSYEAALALAGSADPAALRRALGMLHELGARPAAAVVARRLRALGEQGVPRGPRPGTAANPAGLRPREVEVLQLLAAGLSNAQIAAQLVLSPRTVDNHVAAILRKLGAHTRSEATAQAARLGLTGQRSAATEGERLQAGGELGNDVRRRLRPLHQGDALPGPHRERFDVTGRPDHRRCSLVTDDGFAGGEVRDHVARSRPLREWGAARGFPRVGGRVAQRAVRRVWPPDRVEVGVALSIGLGRRYQRAPVVLVDRHLLGQQEPRAHPRGLGA